MTLHDKEFGPAAADKTARARDEADLMQPDEGNITVPVQYLRAALGDAEQWRLFMSGLDFIRQHSKPSSDSSPPLDVVREWEEAVTTGDLTKMGAAAWGMSRALTAQAKRIEGVEQERELALNLLAGSTAGLKETEATVTELRAELAEEIESATHVAKMCDEANNRATTAEAEVERLTGMKLELCKLIGQVRDERDTARAALAKIDAIRNDIIARQTINWSAHIYPLVAALGDAGYEGVDYETARTALPSPTLPPTKGEGK